MAYTQYQKLVMQYLAKGDFHQAQHYLRLQVGTSSSAANKAFDDRILQELDKFQSKEIVIPTNLLGIITVEYPGPEYTFREERYFLTERERKMAERIETMNAVAQKLKGKNITYVNSLLLHGLSGTGKTTFGRYLAHRLDLPFVYMSVIQVMDSYLGKTGQNITRSFEFINARPCVFMIDEIDAIGERRTGGDIGAGAEMRRVVTALFLAMDKLSNDNIVIGATNRPDILDQALVSRFRERHEVKPLDAEERAGMVIQYLQGTGYWSEGDADRLRTEATEFARTNDLPPRELEHKLIQKIADAEIENRKISLV